ncbi:hypothetical protein GZ77_13185 [Endozoicomonas montiporae]|uniref:Uncharacterized protein n=1 Tax=Endozoicomonas montiporae TaxID=1027273 RepID=A0A081N4I9_9GAMM|nr:hypothetical protein GZ77_13185 [Endozoicomonas montiporae]
MQAFHRRIDRPKGHTLHIEGVIYNKRYQKGYDNSYNNNHQVVLTRTFILCRMVIIRPDSDE